MKQLQPRVYFASKLSKAGFLRELRKAYHEVIVTSRWIDYDHCEPTADDTEMGIFWSCDIVDIAASDYLIVVPPDNPPGDLRGALVEVGVALALNKRIIITGEHESYGTWHHLPHIIHYPNPIDALADIINYHQKGS